MNSKLIITIIAASFNSPMHNARQNVDETIAPIDITVASFLQGRAYFIILIEVSNSSEAVL